ncbi:MAG TPA: hypothetical protein VIH42_10295, partial [Thermoguttaceae bacterium]
PVGQLTLARLFLLLNQARTSFPCSSVGTQIPLAKRTESLFEGLARFARIKYSSLFSKAATGHSAFGGLVGERW